MGARQIKKVSQKNRMRIAVVGGGIFGITVAVRLASEGHTVELFEKENKLLQAASGINQFRLHRGYHYPRSAETTIESMRTEISFRREYEKAIINDGEQYYCIANEGSLISPENYVRFCKRFGLKFQRVRPTFLNNKKIALCLRVQESRIDIEKLGELCRVLLRKNGVRVHLGISATAETLKQFDFSTICTYANINELLSNHFNKLPDYQFELCEKPVVQLPSQFNRKGIVIMDGPFMCIDPLGRTGKFLFGNVVHAIHQTNIGKYPKFKKEFSSLLNHGIIKNPPITNFSQFVKSAFQFIPEIIHAKHIGSMYTFRTVLPNREATDERPTVVTRVADNIVTVFSGKFSNCVEAADRVSDIVHDITSI